VEVDARCTDDVSRNDIDRGYEGVEKLQALGADIERLHALTS